MLNRWSNNAIIRQEQIESGLDITFNNVFLPIFIEYICSYKPQRVLEVGAGTGHMSKELAKQNLSITAIEPSVGMYKVAKEVLSESNVELLMSTPADLAECEKYDLAFSHLVAHVVEDLECFLGSVAIHIKKKGNFIFSIPHPCFFNDYKKIFDKSHNYMLPLATEISFKITKDNKNEICGVPYYHRPLSHYINCIIKSGFNIDEFKEIYPDDKVQMLYGSLWDKPRYCMFICYKK
ncbi:class I SAM-dependent methyltransferase [Ruminiclostridium cellobioparum]|uniref:Methyltransferase domain-containing protein n=1 Tax=Ruminiclostridium cellobioparum subsp. termitidis CT1112 TaxID=1195236 RepID=S0FHL7_RUMCE|nr:class I SAM-dependent methyltransferase [Ruminiclostridium cellobioparum]EMS71260.1 methyltransferase domain-containing protein [Ruminiclostridium cellobioparum subsp. termitidis CT1112]